jgi:carbonic anhydrase/acetyltransferase-like protein (isoleucine patch superfamily)
MPLYEFEGKRPTIHPSAWVAPSADIIGSVSIGPLCYVGWGAILRGDHGSIELQEGTAVEEGVIIHTPKDFTSRFGKQATLGHGAMLHGATVERFAVIGMRTTIANFGVVGEWAIIGEAGLVKNSQVVPPHSVAVGQPVKVIGDITEAHKEKWRSGKQAYIDFAKRNQKSLRLIEYEEV